MGNRPFSPKEEVICAHIFCMNYAHSLMTVDGCNMLSQKLAASKSSKNEFFVLLGHLYTSLFIFHHSYRPIYKSFSLTSFYSTDMDHMQDLSIFKDIIGQEHNFYINDFSDLVFTNNPLHLMSASLKKTQLFLNLCVCIYHSIEFHHQCEHQINQFLTLLFEDSPCFSNFWLIKKDLTFKRLQKYAVIVKRFIMESIIQRQKHDALIKEAFNDVVMYIVHREKQTSTKSWSGK